MDENHKWFMQSENDSYIALINALDVQGTVEMSNFQITDVS
jgi:hypothetical protein